MGNILSDSNSDKEKNDNHNNVKNIKIINKQYIYTNNKIELCNYCKKYEKCIMSKKNINYQHCNICQRYIDK